MTVKAADPVENGEADEGEESTPPAAPPAKPPRKRSEADTLLVSVSSRVERLEKLAEEKTAPPAAPTPLLVQPDPPKDPPKAEKPAAGWIPDTLFSLDW